ncbi:MAG: undecaprenyldiphospho-muramoylpentapeptide beta-N-acetylglucosaminyltransferase [Aquificaceae bacterium]|jgi:UDP-N-acetylglucosamine--N-acetylmuramyl-(pentapeptide) pyrophosphoryl-undecaprenol N-acetylglucosamine transferase|uniref:undecaprenyldiphospho-muramoylpentapeptide beta-N-acetylglucosaminyltransferase n=1 Tax=Hydrogenobacter sp. Uz 6-8 TaxID=3384828 RepID=UPI0030B474CD
MKVFVSGGGTGGHFFPALALIECLLEKGVTSAFVGSERGIEKKLIDRIPVQSHFVQSHPFMGRSIRDKFSALFKNLLGSIRTAELVSKEDKAVVFGGYASLPLGLACLFKRASLYLHEQNSIPSRTNRLLTIFAKRVFITFEYSRRYFPEDKTVRTGLPIRSSLLEGLKLRREEALSELGLEDRTTLLVMGGSQGANFLNEIAPQVLLKTGWQGIHITGEKDYERVKSLYEGKSMKVLTLPFSHKMNLIYRASTVALSRAGAGTVTELSLYGVPSLFVPFPHAVGNHQFYNAKEIEEIGGGLVLTQEEADTDSIIQRLNRLIADYESFSKNIKAFANPLACEEMAKYILEEEGL